MIYLFDTFEREQSLSTNNFLFNDLSLVMNIQRIFAAFISVVVILTLNLSCKKESPTEIEPIADTFAILPGTAIVEQNYISGKVLKVSFNGEFLGNSLFDWSSLDERIATVDERGVVYGLWIGETEIIAKFRDGEGEARCKVTVVDSKPYKFRIILKNKGASTHSIDRPLEFLSQQAVNRRNRQDIKITETDMPISSDYLRQIEQVGGIIVAKSKWLNTVVVHNENAIAVERYRQLPFVQDVIPVWTEYAKQNNEPIVSVPPGSAIWQNAESFSFDKEAYKESWGHLVVNNGGTLHRQGFKGNEISIAVIDGGYEKLDVNPLFSNSKIKEVKSFIFEQPNPYLLDKHGVNVAGLMAINKPSVYIGTAPEAEYWLFSTDDSDTEFLVEEDYLVNALEYADSIGIDVVNISLSYDNFEGFMGSYLFEDMDGKTAISSRAANMAFEKGMFIVSSAGNQNRWVSAPTDAPSVLAVGAVRADSTITAFSSHGLTIDGRVKPDIVSLGQSSLYIVESDGSISRSRYGTSFSSPIMTGLVACLWQAYPTLTNKELFDVILKSANRYASPLLPYGYGLPDMEYALFLAKEITDKK